MSRNKSENEIEIENCSCEHHRIYGKIELSHDFLLHKFNQQIWHERTMISNKMINETDGIKIEKYMSDNVGWMRVPKKLELDT